MRDTESKQLSRTIPPVKLLLWLLVLAGFAFGVRSAVNRYNVEVANRRVEVTVDYAELRSMAAAQGVPIIEVLAKFKVAGVTSVALSEDTIGGLEDAGGLMVDVGAARTGAKVTALVESAGDGGELLRRVEEALRAKTRYQVGGGAPMPLHSAPRPSSR